MSGALISHIQLGDFFGETFLPALLLMLAVACWYSGPAERKVDLLQ
jgi:hypothetical protein